MAIRYGVSCFYTGSFLHWVCWAFVFVQIREAWEAGNTKREGVLLVDCLVLYQHSITFFHVKK